MLEFLYNVYSKKGGYKKNELSDAHKSKVQMVRDSQVIEAKNVDIAKQIFLDEVNEKFNDGGDSANDSSMWVSTNVDNCEFIDIVDETGMSASTPSTMFLKLASPMNYTFTTEERKFLKHEGTCVEDNLLGIYNPLIKSFTLESIRKIASTFYDINLIDWTPDMGYSSDAILRICQNYKISMYAYDIMNTCFLKHVVEQSKHNYPALFFYAINNHMYLVKDTDKCKSLREKAKENSKSFNTSLIEKEKKINYYNELPIHENIDIKNLKGFDSCIVIYSRDGYTNINDIFLKCLELYGVPLSKSIKANKTNITYFEYVFGKKVYIIVQDPNDLKLFNWKIIKSLCEKHNIEFTNQTYPSFINSYKRKFFDDENKRIEFTPKQKQKLLKFYENKCNNCEEECSKDFEIDHIIPISAGGSSKAMDNLQVLCALCYKKKTQNEKEHGCYVKINNTESSFNNQVQTIMDSELSS
jgi:hypothetical protein